MTITETPTRGRATLAERLILTGEATLDIAALLPPDTYVIDIGTGGGWYRVADVKLQVGGMPDAFDAIQAFGGIWRHTLSQAEATRVHHHWHGVINGATVNLTAIWDAPVAGEPRG